MLSRQSGTKQIIMVTDGEPTAHIEGGEAYFQYPPSPVTIEETLKEVMRCTRDGIRINTFMLDESYYLRVVRRADDAASTAAGRSSPTPTRSATTCSSTSSTSAASTAAPADATLADVASLRPRYARRGDATSASSGPV